MQRRPRASACRRRGRIAATGGSGPLNRALKDSADLRRSSTRATSRPPASASSATWPAPDSSRTGSRTSSIEASAAAAGVASVRESEHARADGPVSDEDLRSHAVRAVEAARSRTRRAPRGSRWTRIPPDRPSRGKSWTRAASRRESRISCRPFARGAGISSRHGACRAISSGGSEEDRDLHVSASPRSAARRPRP